MTLVIGRESTSADRNIPRSETPQTTSSIRDAHADATKKNLAEFVVTAREAARYACEDKLRSWASVLPTVFITTALQVALFVNPFSWVSPLLSIALACFLVRVFIFFHDVQHKALFRHSRLGRWMLQPFTVYFVYPPWVWRDRHNLHHKKNCQIDDPSVDGQVSPSSPPLPGRKWAKVNVLCTAWCVAGPG